MGRSRASTIELMGENNQTGSDARFSLFPVIAIASGVTLILVSFIPLGQLATQSDWTGEDAAAYSEIRRECHRSAYQSAARAGLTEEQQKTRQEELKERFERMTAKLEQARNRPHWWSRKLLWAGAMLTALGVFYHSRRIQ